MTVTSVEFPTLLRYYFKHGFNAVEVAVKVRKSKEMKPYHYSSMFWSFMDVDLSLEINFRRGLSSFVNSESLKY